MALLPIFAILYISLTWTLLILVLSRSVDHLLCFSINQPLTLQHKGVSTYYMPRLNHSEAKNKILCRTTWYKLAVFPLQNPPLCTVCHWEVKTLLLPQQDALKLLPACCLAGDLDQALLSGEKEKEERDGYASKNNNNKNGEKTESCSCFASAICCLLSTTSRQWCFPEISRFPRHALLPLLPPAGCARCLPTGQIHHPRSVSVRFLLLAAREGVLFALPKCSRGLMLRCYVQTISAIMNHVLPPLYSTPAPSSFFLSSKQVWVSVFATDVVHAGYTAQAELFLPSHRCWDQ